MKERACGAAMVWGPPERVPERGRRFLEVDCGGAPLCRDQRVHRSPCLRLNHEKREVSGLTRKPEHALCREGVCDLKA